MPRFPTAAIPLSRCLQTPRKALPQPEKNICLWWETDGQRVTIKVGSIFHPNERGAQHRLGQPEHEKTAGPTAPGWRQGRSRWCILPWKRGDRAEGCLRLVQSAWILGKRLSDSSHRFPDGSAGAFDHLIGMGCGDKHGLKLGRRHINAPFQHIGKIRGKGFRIGTKRRTVVGNRFFL